MRAGLPMRKGRHLRGFAGIYENRYVTSTVASAGASLSIGASVLGPHAQQILLNRRQIDGGRVAAKGLQ